MKTLLFVYGTLRQNYHNHTYLNTANFLGEAKTQDKFVMHFNGSIPFVSESQSISQIMGEVYEVDESTLARVDQLEGCYPISHNPIQFDSESWYIRKQVAVKIIGTDNVISVWLYFNKVQTTIRLFLPAITKSMIHCHLWKIVFGILPMAQIWTWLKC